MTNVKFEMTFLRPLQWTQ